MSLMSKVNLNDEVKVVLTKEGEQVLALKHKCLRETILENGGEDLGEFILRLEGGFYVTQLWILMNDFKDYMDWNAETVFKGNELFFLGRQTRKGCE